MLACCTLGVLSTKRNQSCLNLFHLKLGTLAPSSGIFWTYSSDTPFPVVFFSKELYSQDRKRPTLSTLWILPNLLFSALGELTCLCLKQIFQKPGKILFFKCYSRHTQNKEKNNFPWYKKGKKLSNAFLKYILQKTYIYIFFSALQDVYKAFENLNNPPVILQPRKIFFKGLQTFH